MKSTYQKHGYENRAEYLESIADDYGIDLHIVQSLADMLGETEDFDGLISAIEDYSMMF